MGMGMGWGGRRRRGEREPGGEEEDICVATCVVWDVLCKVGGLRSSLACLKWGLVICFVYHAGAEAYPRNAI